MGKSVEERCNQILGTKEGADYFQAIGSYKSEDMEETYYHFGVFFHLPAKLKNTGDADQDKINILWAKRMVSADNAGIPALIKDNKITPEKAAEILLAYDGEGFLVKLNEVKVREAAGPKTDSIETLAIKKLAGVLKSKTTEQLAAAKVPIVRLDNPPKTEKGRTNFISWAKLQKEAEHPWYAVAYKQVSSEKGFD